MTPEHGLLLAAAAFAAGALNAVAGGGSFLTFPALVFTGVPPIVANATSAVAVSPGYLGSTWGLRQELAGLPRQRLRREAGIAAAGGVLGALLLLVTPADTFRALVPWLLLFATGVFMAGPALVRRLTRHRGQAPGALARAWGLLAVSVYGGYFNGGLGILLMALYAVTGETRIHTANALKNLNSLVLSWLSVATFAVAGAIAWGPALLMMAAATAGGYAGARAARQLPAQAVRALVTVTGLLMSAVFFLRD
ncbi:Sulfite exporter TauE/SafE [Tepidimonas thermarum]|uniref:Probable membrane transporter protein n=1 Tax=Tepidimonas thermarum TaxID=335431 RepID=A0A554X483_9BURK|nr:sulfite exporter TauE/SafE family protein [Tepidimonas thermarum]TSE30647.1 Sulfite exporter TauE/SafE [Tepidimonas thermarum]